MDVALVDRGLARSRSVARELVADGRVSVDGRVVAKASSTVDASSQVDVEGTQEIWVGRAAHKLLGALEVFRGIDPAGQRVIDLGASTGGFTQVLLTRGATRVEAVDVGHGQLAAEVRDDPRVRDHSGRNLRDLDPADIGGPADLVVADLSFISLRLVLRRMAALLTPDGDLVVLVKPQFEVGKERLGHKGVVTSARERARAVREVVDSVHDVGLHVRGAGRSTLPGTSGNQEYLLWLRHDPTTTMTQDEIETFVRGIEQEETP